MEPAGFSSGASKPRTKTKGRPRRLSCSSSSATQKPDSYGRLLIELESLKEKSLARCQLHRRARLPNRRRTAQRQPAKRAMRSDPIDAVRPSPYRCGNRRCGSWPGSMLTTWKIPAAAAAGWWTTWPEMGY